MNEEMNKRTNNSKLLPPPQRESWDRGKETTGTGSYLRWGGPRRLFWVDRWHVSWILKREEDVILRMLDKAVSTEGGINVMSRGRKVHMCSRLTGERSACAQGWRERGAHVLWIDRWAVHKLSGLTGEKCICSQEWCNVRHVLWGS